MDKDNKNIFKRYEKRNSFTTKLKYKIKYFINDCKYKIIGYYICFILLIDDKKRCRRYK